ncbi:MAG: GNAT family N-acetyltransferase [Alphaproteobacteria bacterium]|nr:GNAT family N-acetyltransferase [Alphaproteobacteria bacterium]
MSLESSRTKSINTSAVVVRLTESPDEIEAAQRLRYKVFYEEYGAKPSAEMKITQLDIDDYDKYTDHLIVVDSLSGHEKIVGTYRLLRQERAKEYGQFYTSNEFDLTSLLNTNASVLELGRSCVLQEYRTRPILNMLWQGIAEFVSNYKIDIMFGCASLHGTDIDHLSAQLSYLYHFHVSPEDICPRALDKHYVDMNIIPKKDLNQRKAFSALPPLIKGYLRLGASIGDGAVIDKQFNTTDICIVAQTHLLSERYLNHYERKNQKTIVPTPSQEQSEQSSDKKDS